MGAYVKVKSLQSETFMRGLKRLMKQSPEIASIIAREMADEVVIRAKRYFLEGGPSEHPWAALYFAGDKIGESTPQWWAEGKKGADGKGRRDHNRDSFEPLIDTGSLFDSIKTFGTSRSGHGATVKVGSDSPYASMHEFGSAGPDDAPENYMARQGVPNAWTGKVIPARPFLAPALLEVERDRAFQNEIKRRIKLEFKKVLDTAR